MAVNYHGKKFYNIGPRSVPLTLLGFFGVMPLDKNGSIGKVGTGILRFYFTKIYYSIVRNPFGFYYLQLPVLFTSHIDKH